MNIYMTCMKENICNNLPVLDNYVVTLGYMNTANLRLQFTFGSAIFFKFVFSGQNSGQRIISYFWKKNLKKAKYWRRNGGFTFSPEVKVYLLIDSPTARMQSTETIFAGITYMDVTNWLLSWSALLFWLPSIFGIRCVSIKL